MNKKILKSIILILITTNLLSSEDLIQKEPLIIKYISGKPYMAHFNYSKEIAKEWGINIKYIFKGCVVTKKINKEREKIEVANQKAYIYYEKKLGKNWKDELNKEVKKRINKGDK